MSQVTSRNPVRINAEPSQPKLLTNTGGTLYYKDDSAVSSSSNDGSVADTASLSFSTPKWIISASESLVRVDDNPAVIHASALAADTQSAYRRIVSWATGNLSNSTPNSTYFLYNSGLVDTAATNASFGGFYLDPADYTVGTLTTKYRLVAQLQTNAVSLGTTTITAGLYPISAVAGSGGSITFTPGTVTSGSTVAFVNPGTGGKSSSNSGDFTAPAAGPFVFGVVVTATPAANSSAILSVSLQGRNV